MITNRLDIILHCPRCKTQHIDRAEPETCENCGHEKRLHDDRDISNICTDCAGAANECKGFKAWLNPPHKSHRCLNCNIVWRPADFCTNGVASVKTRGENDTWPEGA
jgi:hypothetical protein